VIVLTETELTAVDLTSDGWPLHRVPYLLGLNASSPVTCVEHVTSVSDTVWTNIAAAGNASAGNWSTKVAHGVYNSWNLKLLLEILEIAWNLVDAPGKFCNQQCNFRMSGNF